MTTARDIFRQRASVSASGPAASDRSLAMAALRLALAKLDGHPVRSSAPALALGIPDIDTRLPTRGLAPGILHEFAGVSHGDRPAAFGFVAALISLAQQRRKGPAVLVATRAALTHFGKPYGHGLRALGLDPGRLLLIEARRDQDAFWALEETLRSEARPSAVAGAVEGAPDLTASRRLNLAAVRYATPLFLLGPPKRHGESAAATRWRISAASGARDQVGALAHLRWDVALTRARNGRPGKWLLEWDHVTHRFRMVEGVADRAPDALHLRRAG